MLEVPQWQGSGSRTAHRLRRGSAALARMLPADERVVTAVDQRPGRPADVVAALDVLAENLAACRAARDRAGGELVVTVGGDRSMTLDPGERAFVRDNAVALLDACR